VVAAQRPVAAAGVAFGDAATGGGMTPTAWPAEIWPVLSPLLTITLLAGLIGYERERHGRAAGLRTHMLVGVGSCLVMMTGMYLYRSSGAVVDPTRMAAQVVSGLGFLGGGAILRYGASVRGLTTAAGLWAVGLIGIAVGAGFVVGAAVSSALVLIVLWILRSLERAISKGGQEARR
jgi:putative Mg2+ transporter-C (MgtC) family protein